MSEKEKDLRKNAEGYLDLTAYEAIKKADEELERYHKLIGCLLRVCELAGFQVEGRISVKDKRTGKVWK